MATTTATQIQQLYVGLLGRAADQGGLNWWVEEVTTGGRTLEDIRASFVTSTEYTTTYGAATTRTDLVTAIYSNLFERTPSADELAYWVSTDTRPADQLVTAFLEFASTADQAVINNKTFVAQTYTDTVGNRFSAEGAKAVIANVDGTAASVADALELITSGTLPGQVAGLNLINAVAASTQAIADYEKSVAASNPDLDTKEADGVTDGKDGVVTSEEATAAAEAAAEARFDSATGVSEKATATLVSEAKSTAAAAAASKEVVKATTGGTAALATYEKAVAAQKALVGSTAATDTKTALEVATEKATSDSDAALAALDVAVTSEVQTSYAKLEAAYGAPLADKVALKAALNGSAAGKAALLTELAKVTDFAPKAIDAVAKEAAFVKAANDIDVADDAAVLNTDTYLAKLAASDAAAALVVKAQAADAAIDAVKVVTDKFATLENADAVAKAALQTFVDANGDKVAISDIAGTAATVQATDKSDIFYFGSKAVADNDFAIGGTTNFGAGDSIVLGSGYTFNSGALSTGNSNTLEFFLVKGAAGTQVVIETEAYGNSTTTVDASGNVTASENATVITLTGVTADHVSVANGVISYV